MNIKFERANIHHLDVIMEWLSQPHIKDFWDNSEEHRQDIINFVHGRKTPSPYYQGIYTYWIGSILNSKKETPFSLIMTSPFEAWVGHSLSKSGKTVTLDFAIGNTDYLGKDLAAPTLQEFMLFYQLSVEQSAHIFFIDPDEKNNKAIHVYKKAGFRQRGRHSITEGYFKGNTNLIMIKFLPQIAVPALNEDKQVFL
ncbi:GNAT family N-acetyltransferase [Candidatus Odyssella thessalonicensis]|uniref:GNAT family N-acetyltransferase n=1 Tax=Candidatus Odyssella thessalonicensis TaxID=84647 RepID=UPI000225B95D|nr:GNAT family N-acetyltransferase [Candidatus Odyssella thessalonicensis]